MPRDSNNYALYIDRIQNGINLDLKEAYPQAELDMIINLRNYWTSFGPYDEIFYYMKENVSEIRDDFILMVSGERIETKMREYAVTAKDLNTKEQAYSAMVIYGLLTYEDGEVFIPNKELMDQFNQLLLSNESLGYVHRLARSP